MEAVQQKGLLLEGPCGNFDTSNGEGQSLLLVAYRQAPDLA